jgi:hypothetical protein
MYGEGQKKSSFSMWMEDLYQRQYSQEMPSGLWLAFSK